MEDCEHKYKQALRDTCARDSLERALESESESPAKSVEDEMKMPALTSNAVAKQDIMLEVPMQDGSVLRSLVESPSHVSHLDVTLLGIPEVILL